MTTNAYGNGYGTAGSEAQPSATSTSKTPSSRPRRRACSPCSTTASCWTLAARRRRSRPPTGRSPRKTSCTRRPSSPSSISSLKTDSWDGADGLIGLYNYAFTALVNANIQRDPALTREAIELLEPLRQAWHEAAAAVPAPAAAGHGTAAAFPPQRPPPSRQPGPGTPSPEQAAGASVLAEQADSDIGLGGAGSNHAESTLTESAAVDTALAAWMAVLDVLEMAVQAAERTLKDPLGPLSSASAQPRGAAARGTLDPADPARTAAGGCAASRRRPGRRPGTRCPPAR